MATLVNDGGAATTSRPRRRPRNRPGLAWLGLAPFFVFVGFVFLMPIGFILFDAFRKTTTSSGTVRDPVTQQFVHTSKTSFTGANVSQSLRGVYLTSLETSVKLSAIVGVLGAVLGVVLAWAVVNSRSSILRQVVTSASAVLANFGGIPLAFLFIATLDANSGILTTFLQDHFHFSLVDDGHVQLSQLSGLSLVYLYFLVPLMVLVMTPALEGLKPQWGEAAENLGASRWAYWRYVAGPVLMPSFLGSVLLLFCSSFSAFATAYAINSSFPLVTIRIQSVLSGNVLPGQENLGAALALDMIVIVLPLTVVYQLLQRRTSRWLA
ncbi:ABC transporter permease [uncultured Jatrophihabitans sp.]|uniref:ABC transporter permease n=1 Tax=uncultured Jatrophihabitans sp. TaxID=1610747 RepID=UPI0035C9EF55